VESLQQDIERQKKLFDATSKKNNEARIQIEAQRRLIDRALMEK